LKVKLKLYSKSHEICKDYGYLHRVLRSIAATLFFFALTILLRNVQHMIFLVFLALFGFVILADKYGRRIFSDWPKRKYMEGEITFETTRIHVLLGEEKVLDSSEIAELIFFYDQYTGWSSGPVVDIDRNGNALIFVRMKNKATEFYKFNIRTKEEFKGLEKLIDSYVSNIPSVFKKKVTDIPYILTSDLVERRLYH
jgi:hypothetical protein